ncbi:hypothetical protein AAMO2058_000619800 [Amorphochlora amoebiformis]
MKKSKKHKKKSRKRKEKGGVGTSTEAEKKKKKKKKKKKRKRRRREYLPEDESDSSDSDVLDRVYRSLVWAVKQGDLATLQMFNIGRPINSIPIAPEINRSLFLISHRDSLGLSLLDYACQSGKLAICKWLIGNKKADPRATAPTSGHPIPDFAGWRPLHHACAYNKPLIAEYLVSETDAVKDRDVKAPVGDRLTREKRGVTPEEMGLKRLLDMAPKWRKDREKVIEEERREVQRKREKERRQEEQRQWNEKLHHAMAEDWSDMYGVHAKQDEDDYRDHMTTDEWAEFIAFQRRKRNNQQYQPSDTSDEFKHPKPPKQGSASPPPFAWDHRKSRGEVHTTTRVSPEEIFGDLSVRFETFESEAKTKNHLSPKDIPFPDNNSGYFEGLKIALRAAGDKAKRILRTLFLKWHPDKFMGRYRSKLKQEDIEVVSKRVTAVQQALTAIKKEFDL